VAVHPNISDHGLIGDLQTAALVELVLGVQAAGTSLKAVTKPLTAAGEETAAAPAAS